MVQSGCLSDDLASAYYSKHTPDFNPGGKGGVRIGVKTRFGKLAARELFGERGL